MPTMLFAVLVHEQRDLLLALYVIVHRQPAHPLHMSRLGLANTDLF